MTLLQYLLGHTVRVTGTATNNGVVVATSSWRTGLAGLITALAGLLMFLVLTGAITRAVAAEAAGEDPGVEQSYRLASTGWERFCWSPSSSCWPSRVA